MTPLVRAGRSGRRVVVRVAPVPHGSEAMLERLDLDRHSWHEAAHRALGMAGRTRFTLRAAGVYRVRVSGGGGLSAAVSPVLQYRPGRYHR